MFDKKQMNGGRRRLAMWLVCALAFVGGSWQASAAAQTCVQPAVGVFGKFGPPIWFAGAAPQFPPPLDEVITDVNDPRWNGAWQQAFGNGAVDDGALKALYKQVTIGAVTTRYLFLQFSVDYDPIQGVAPVTNNIVYVGFQNNAQTQTTVLSVNLTDGTNTGPGTIKPLNAVIKTLASSTATTGTVVATPTWLSSRAAGWVYIPTGLSTRWTVNLFVPVASTGLADGLDLETQPFKMWYEAQVPTPGAMSPTAAWYKSPGTAVDVTKVFDAGSGKFVESYPPANTWGAARWATGPTDVNCPGGISMSISDIGTVDTGQPSISVKWAHTPPYPSNTLFARPLNNTASAIPMGGIKATFRIANWGSQIGVGGTWETIASNVLNGPAIPVGNAAHVPTFFPITQSWTLVPADTLYQGLAAGTAPDDQCLLVQLSSNGAPLVFVNDSVRSNLIFGATNSPFTKTAEISVVNLPPLPGGGATRDVYLYVQTANMPGKVTPGGEPAPSRPTAAATPPPQNAGRIANVNTDNRVQTPPPVQAPPSSTDTLIESYPTYIVRVFHSTDRGTVTGGVEYPLLEQQDSFGYRILARADQVVTGWDHTLTGATPIAGAPNWYKLDVPNNGTKKITTTIVALEAFDLAKWLKGIQWWVWLLIILILLIIIIWLARRKP